MNEVFLILGMVIVTYAIRYPIIPLLGRVKIPPAFFEALRFVPPVVLSAIIAPALLTPQGALAIGPTNIRLVAGLVAIIIAWRTKHLLLTIISGMLTLWLLQVWLS